MTLYTGLTQETSWVGAAMGGGAGGVVFGLIGSRVLFPRDPELRAAVAAARAAGRRRVARATRRGPVPDDPEVRSAAAAMTAYQLSVMERQRRWGPLFYMLMVVLAGALALTRSPWYWAAAAFFAFLLVLQVTMLGRLRRRAELLGRAEG